MACGVCPTHYRITYSPRFILLRQGYEGPDTPESMPKKEPKKEASHIDNILGRLPEGPGVYQMKNEAGDVIYVGKAKSLVKRVTSYFRDSKQHSMKTRRMVREIADIQYIQVGSELEALVLETSLIKQLRPRYNILMRDDKNHLYIKITIQEDYPRIMTTRKVVDDGALYFGPKTSSKSVFSTLKLLRKLFPYRSCNLEITDKDGDVLIGNKTIRYPCIYYHIKRCVGPCVQVCNPGYKEMIGNIVRFLRGEYKDIARMLEEDMKRQATERLFEKAAKTRDLLQSVRTLMERQNVNLGDITEEHDAIGYVHMFGKYFIHLFQIREGAIIGQENFCLDDTVDEEAEAGSILRSFILDYYQRTPQVPRVVLLPEVISDQETIGQWLKELSGHAVEVCVPQRGARKELVKLSTTNAEAFAQQQKTKWMTEEQRTVGATKDLARAIGFEGPFHRMECYDISHLGGTATVGSMVVFKDGKPSKKDYRRFEIKSLEPGAIDDFRSMAEVLIRRLKRLAKEQATGKEETSFGEIPDLIIIDGGKGQLSSVYAVMKKLGLRMPLISLAKREEEVFLPERSDPIILPRETAALYLIQNIRDEAHRFAISYNRNVRSKKLTKSILDEIPGIGPKNKKLLLTTYGDVHAIEQASFEDLSAVVGEKLAQNIKEVL